MFKMSSKALEKKLQNYSKIKKELLKREGGIFNI